MAEATAAGKLSYCAKVGTALEENGAGAQPHLICVYVRDWADRDDVRMVLRRLLLHGC